MLHARRDDADGQRTYVAVVPNNVQNSDCQWQPRTLTYHRLQNDHRLIPGLHTALARSGLGIPGAHCKDGTPDTLTPESRSRRGVS